MEMTGAELLQLVGLALIQLGVVILYTAENDPPPPFVPPEDEVPGAPGVPRIPTKETR